MTSPSRDDSTTCSMATPWPYSAKAAASDSTASGSAVAASSSHASSAVSTASIISGFGGDQERILRCAQNDISAQNDRASAESPLSDGQRTVTTTVSGASTVHRCASPGGHSA